LGAIMYGATAALHGLARSADRQAFELAYPDWVRLGTREELYPFWMCAREATIKDHAEGLAAIATLEQLNRHAAVAARLEAAHRNLYDRACAPEVAVWILLGTLREWTALFGASAPPLGDVDDADMIDAVKRLRAGASPAKLRMRLEWSE